MATDPVLWTAMEARRKSFRPPIHPTALCHDKTRRKIKLGIVLERGDVYDRLDQMLRWVPGDARRAAIDGVPPRPLEAEAGRSSARRLHVVSVLAQAASMAANDPDVPDDVLDDTERQAQEILDRLRGGKK